MVFLKKLPSLGEDFVQLHCVDTDSFVFPFTPIKGLIKLLKHFSKSLHLSKIDPTLELLSKVRKG